MRKKVAENRLVSLPDFLTHFPSSCSYHFPISIQFPISLSQEFKRVFQQPANLLKELRPQQSVDRSMVAG